MCFIKFIKYFKIRYGILLFVLLTAACSDHGIEPKAILKSPPGFSGTIRFISEWPDSIKRSFLVIFKNPLKSDSDFTVLNLKFLSKEIPLGVQKHEFSSLDSAYIPAAPGVFSSGSYFYVAVVQQSTENLSLARKDWFVSGVYYTNNDTTVPGVLIIPDSTFVKNININVDFKNPPPQPPGGN
ncbi:MAG: hypothetical protein PHY57_02630 [Ignavibacterium sp.]|jgi:hypothetical protein|nr:hypothetical protein [Ignavibacterium sp.]MDX9710917.1 hypothetical protein [Ignavibacteriaceae bacterium]MEB2355645.1 hypothetical protein [Ignavibacteriales bacterium]